VNFVERSYCQNSRLRKKQVCNLTVEKPNLPDIIFIRGFEQSVFGRKPQIALSVGLHYKAIDKAVPQYSFYTVAVHNADTVGSAYPDATGFIHTGFTVN
jgi:hypothetical protein